MEDALGLGQRVRLRLRLGGADGEGAGFVNIFNMKKRRDEKVRMW